ncbi:transketolase-like TK C-terminal-containing protein, partial [Clostridium butyricum]
VSDGNDIDAISKAIDEAKAEVVKPTLIIVKNVIGFGCPSKQGKASAHGEPLGADNIRAMKENLGWKPEPDFYVPDEVYSNMDEYIKEGQAKEESWNNLFKEYKSAYPELASQYEEWMSGKVKVEALESEEFWSFDKSIATRQSSGMLINRLAEIIPNLIGGSADLAPSNKTNMDSRGDFSAEDRSGSNLHFGVREHAMVELFDAQDEEYKESVMPKCVRSRVAVEALSSFGWHKYTGLDGEVISLDTFGASGPADKLFKQFGFTVENVVNIALKVAGK